MTEPDTDTTEPDTGDEQLDPEAVDLMANLEDSLQDAKEAKSAAYPETADEAFEQAKADEPTEDDDVRGPLSTDIDYHEDGDVQVAVPTLARMVLYRSKVNPYELPAIVTTTADTLYEPARKNGSLPSISSPLHVHLKVFSPGPTGGYVEHNVPHHTVSGRRAGTWRWPQADPAPIDDTPEEDA